MDKYVVKFGDYYVVNVDVFLGKKRLVLTKDIQAASWLTEEKAIGISEKFGGEICKLNVDIKIVEEV